MIRYCHHCLCMSILYIICITNFEIDSVWDGSWEDAIRWRWGMSKGARAYPNRPSLRPSLRSIPPLFSTWYYRNIYIFIRNKSNSSLTCFECFAIASVLEVETFPCSLFCPFQIKRTVPIVGSTPLLSITWYSIRRQYLVHIQLKPRLAMLSVDANGLI